MVKAATLTSRTSKIQCAGCGAGCKFRGARGQGNAAGGLGSLVGTAGSTLLAVAWGGQGQATAGAGGRWQRIALCAAAPLPLR